MDEAPYGVEAYPCSAGPGSTLSDVGQGDAVSACIRLERVRDESELGACILEFGTFSLDISYTGSLSGDYSILPVSGTSLPLAGQGVDYNPTEQGLGDQGRFGDVWHLLGVEAFTPRKAEHLCLTIVFPPF